MAPCRFVISYLFLVGSCCIRFKKHSLCLAVQYETSLYRGKAAWSWRHINFFPVWEVWYLKSWLWGLIKNTVSVLTLVSQSRSTFCLSVGRRTEETWRSLLLGTLLLHLCCSRVKYILPSRWYLQSARRLVAAIRTATCRPTTHC